MNRLDFAPRALITALAILASGCVPDNERAADFPVLSGAYLGQEPPGRTAELFAPGIISTGMYTRDIAMTPDGNEIYFGRVVGPFTAIMQTKLKDGRWTRPEVAPFSSDPTFMNLEPHVAPDGQRLLFLSTRPPDGSAVKPEDVGAWAHQDIWVMDRVEDGWGEPYNLGPPVNSDDEEYFPSVTLDGTIYFTRTPKGTQESYIYRARWVDGTYQNPERLGPQVNSTNSQFNAFIAPDESYLILSAAGRDDSLGGADYYVVYRSPDDTWSEPVNLGDEINTPRGGEWSPYVSPDGRYLFFMSSRRLAAADFPEALTADYLSEIYANSGNGTADIYWIDAAVIEELRPEGF